MLRPKKLRAPLSAVFLGIFAACTGSMPGDSDDRGGGNGPSSNGGGGGKSQVGGSGQAGGNGQGGSNALSNDGGPLGLRRLTRTEYDYTLRDLLGDTSRPGKGFPEESRGSSGFFEPVDVSGVEVQRFRDAAEGVAAAAAAKGITKLAPCAAGTADEACAMSFISNFGKRAFRRPLDSTESSDLMKLYKTLRAAPISHDHAGALQWLLTAILQSPQFLYHWELGASSPKAEAGIVKLTQFELASRLSYTLWSSMPDDTLLAAAEAGKLGNAAQVEEQARRLLKDKRASETVKNFFHQFIDAEKIPGLAKDTAVYKEFDQELIASMQAETDAFLDHVIATDGQLATILRAPYSFINAKLAKVYGVSGVTGTELRKVDLDPKQRFGLFTQAAFLSVHANTYETSPVLRGKHMRTRLLCDDIPPPPPDVDTMIGIAKMGQQTREKYIEHENRPSCAACHRAMDPLGFAFESYDGIGGWRTLDAGRPVNTTGTVNIDDKDVNFLGAQDLMVKVADSQQGRACMAKQWFRFGTKRADLKGDEASIAQALEAFSASDYDIRELLVALVKTRSFQYRTPSTGEMLQ